MKLQVRSKDTHIFYPLATWSFNREKTTLTQRIPKIREVRFSTPGFKSPPIEISDQLIRPSLLIGQEIILSDVVYYIDHCEVAETEDHKVAVFVYYLSCLPQRVPVFWTVDVVEETVKGVQRG
jgi:hypothetical protein